MNKQWFEVSKNNYQLIGDDKKVYGVIRVEDKKTIWLEVKDEIRPMPIYFGIVKLKKAQKWVEKNDNGRMN